MKRAESALTAMNLGSAAESIARLADADGVAIYVSEKGLRQRLVAAHGMTIPRGGYDAFLLPPE